MVQEKYKSLDEYILDFIITLIAILKRQFIYKTKYTKVVSVLFYFILDCVKYINLFSSRQLK